MSKEPPRSEKTDVFDAAGAVVEKTYTSGGRGRYRYSHTILDVVDFDKIESDPHVTGVREILGQTEIEQIKARAKKAKKMAKKRREAAKKKKKPIETPQSQKAEGFHPGKIWKSHVQKGWNESNLNATPIENAFSSQGPSQTVKDYIESHSLSTCGQASSNSGPLPHVYQELSEQLSASSPLAKDEENENQEETPQDQTGT